MKTKLLVLFLLFLSIGVAGAAIEVSYATTIFNSNLLDDSQISANASAVKDRIIVSYANAIFSPTLQKTLSSSPIPSSIQTSTPISTLISTPIQSINYSILETKTSATAPEIKETIIEIKNLSNDILFLNGSALSISGHGIKMITVNGNYVGNRNFYVNVTNEKAISIVATDNDGNITIKNISLTTDINSKTITSNPTIWNIIGVIIALIGLLFGPGLIEKYKKYRKDRN